MGLMNTHLPVGDLKVCCSSMKEKQMMIGNSSSESKDQVQNGRLSPKYVLTYFNFRGRAELARLVFVAAGIEFEDKRITSIEEWIKLKSKVPFGQLPVLDVDGVQICQAQTIARFLAREFGLAGKNSLEQAKTDMVIDCVMDMMDPIMPCFREKDPEKKEDMRTNYYNVLPEFMEKMEKLLKSNNGGDGYFVGDKMTVADIAVMNAWHWIPGFGILLPVHEYPKLQAHREKMEATPRIAEWLERRPETPV